jgi:hypothetical protein
MKRFLLAALTTMAASSALAGVYCHEKSRQFHTAINYNPNTGELIVINTLDLDCEYNIPNGRDGCEFDHTYSALYKPWDDANIERDIPLGKFWHTHSLDCEEKKKVAGERNVIGNLCNISGGRTITFYDRLTLGPVPLIGAPGNGTKTLVKRYKIACPQQP